MHKTKFSIGQIIHHKLFDYTGIIFDVDFQFSGTEEWYEQVARSKPPKNQPWYKVLVNDATHQTYVAEQNLEAALQQLEINNPAISVYFTKTADNLYLPKIVKN